MSVQLLLMTLTLRVNMRCKSSRLRLHVEEAIRAVTPLSLRLADMQRSWLPYSMLAPAHKIPLTV